MTVLNTRRLNSVTIHNLTRTKDSEAITLLFHAWREDV